MTAVRLLLHAAVIESIARDGLFPEVEPKVELCSFAAPRQLSLGWFIVNSLDNPFV